MDGRKGEGGRVKVDGRQEDGRRETGDGSGRTGEGMAAVAPSRSQQKRWKTLGPGREKEDG